MKMLKNFAKVVGSKSELMMDSARNALGLSDYSKVTLSYQKSWINYSRKVRGLPPIEVSASPQKVWLEYARNAVGLPTLGSSRAPTPNAGTIIFQGLGLMSGIGGIVIFTANSFGNVPATKEELEIIMNDGIKKIESKIEATSRETKKEFEMMMKKVEEAEAEAAAARAEAQEAIAELAAARAAKATKGWWFR